MVEYIYDQPSRPPQESPHWRSLEHHNSGGGEQASSSTTDDDPLLIHSIDALKSLFQTTLLDSTYTGNRGLAFWSCLLGYCEALTTHKQVRYSLYPIPVDAIERLVLSEFQPPSASSSEETATNSHRTSAREVSNWVWGNVVSKSNAKDEVHANSVYIALRGRVDGKSVDCFGAALCTVIGLRQLGYESILTLSEDHAYESHAEDGKDGLCTCEVSIPGTTKAQKAKRGQETALTFQNSKLTPQTSWLYMGMAPIYCRTSQEIIAAALANLNCLIETKGNVSETNSEPLLIIKRELLWLLKDGGHLDNFPFALCELGFSEEHCTSSRGDTMVSISDLAPVPVTTIEALYHQAITCCKTQYEDKQVYPYTYMGFFHKDGGQDEEHRLGVSLEYFAEACRVASGYKYEWGDTLQLTKVVTKISEFIVHEILGKHGKARTWTDEANAVTTGSKLVLFFDHLLVWEERTNEQFLPILKPNHKTGIGKAFALLSQGIRTQCLDSSITQSRRLRGMLGTALRASKVSVSEIHLAIVSETGRRRKRKAR